MRSPFTVIVAMLLLAGCTPRTVPLPDNRVEAYGQSAAKRFKNGEFTAALRLYEKAYGEAARFDIASLQARYQFNIGRILYECMLFDSAYGYFSRSAAEYTALGQSADAATATLYGTLTRAYRGETDSIEEIFSSAVNGCDERDSITVRMAQLLLLLLSGKTGDARTYADPLIAALDVTDDRLGLGTVYCYKAMAVFSEGDAAAAQLLLDSSLASFSRSPYRYRNWRTLEGKAIISFCTHDTAAGNRWYERAVKAAPDLVRLPDVAVVRECRSRW